MDHNVKCGAARILSATLPVALALAMALATATGAHAQIVNGDFSLGRVGFGSDYWYYPPDTHGDITQGLYTVAKDPKNNNGNWGVYGDHTTGTGPQLLVDGSTVPPFPYKRFWYESVPVVANTTYTITAWVQNLADVYEETNFGISPPTIEFSANGVPFGFYTAPGDVGIWHEMFQTWYSGSNTSVLLSMEDTNLTAIGNDFGIDDIDMESPTGTGTTSTGN
jgi:hypothetical protein